VQGLNTVKRPNKKKRKKKKNPTPTVGENKDPSEKARTGPTTAPGPQTRKFEPNNNNQQPTNQRTNEQATTTEPVNNICISNDYQTAAEAQKEPETYDEHASRNKQTFLLANCKH
jgi:hypothetical protein